MRIFLQIFYGSPNSNSGELFEELITYIKNNFSETYEYIENAYSIIDKIEKEVI